MTDAAWAKVVERAANQVYKQGHMDVHDGASALVEALGVRELIEAAEGVVESRWHADPDVVALRAALARLKGEEVTSG